MSNLSRKSIVTSLQCQRCSRILNVSYDQPEKLKDDGYLGCSGDDKITGASKFHHYITVYPCECTMKAQKNLEKLREILK